MVRLYEFVVIFIIFSMLVFILLVKMVIINGLKL